MSQSGFKILLVEDEFFLAENIKLRLEFNHFEVFLAETGQEALDLIKSQKMDLVLMDILMPVMDGLTAIKKLREEYTKDQLPILALSAKAREVDRNEALTAGANDYLSKPFEMDDLLQLIHKYIKKDS